MSWTRAAALVCCTLALPWLAASASQTVKNPPAPGGIAPTFAADVAPILRAKCVICHRQDGDAPFPLETFEQVRRRGSLIGELTASGYMPPWKPAAESVAFLGDRRLSANEKLIIARWVAEGMPEGAASETSAFEPASGWAWGLPDVTIALPEYAMPAGGADVFRNFVVATPFAGMKYVRGFQFRPQSRAVHHANIRIDRTSASEQLDAADPAAGYEGIILHSAEYPDGHFLGWTPGQAAAPANDLAWPLVGGSYLVVQLHMQPTGSAEPVRPLLGLYFTDTPPRRTPVMIRLGRQDLKIRAGDRHFKTIDTFVTPVSITVTAIQPHSHQRARDVSLSARLPDGSQRTLLRIADWDFRWQDHYRLATPFRLPAGTTLESVFHFDNSDDNARNPIRPARDVAWGWRTIDEMADVWVQVLTETAADGRNLTQLARRKATAEDAVGAEILIAREPAHFNLRNDAASIYLELGEPLKALAHFQAARRIKPHLASAAFNVATALELVRRFDEAAMAYRDAIAMDGQYGLAHARLAALLHRHGALDQAIVAYRDAIAVSAQKATLQCGLGKALLDAEKTVPAIDAFAAALRSEPHNIKCLIDASWLRSAHQDPEVRQPEVAIDAATRAVALSAGGDLEGPSLDALAAALASAGQFDRAAATARRAMMLTTDDDVRKAISERLSLYERRLPFRVTK